MHPEVATVLTNLGNIASDEGDAKQATTYYERALAIREQTVLAGDDPMLLANVINNLAILAFEAKRYDDAIAQHRRALAIREKVTPEGDAVAQSLVNIGHVLRARGAYADALKMFQRALAIAERELGADHPYVGDALLGIGQCSFLLGDLERAQPALERALAIRKKGARPVELGDVELALARTLWGRGQKQPAVELARSAQERFRQSPATKEQLAETEAWIAAHAK